MSAHTSRPVALVTGASRRRGIAAAIALGLAASRWDVATTYWRAYDATMPWGSDPKDVTARPPEPKDLCLNEALRGLVFVWPFGRIGAFCFGMMNQWRREIILSKAVRAQARVQYVANFESVVIKPLMAIMNLLIRATLKRENEQKVLVMSTIYGTLIKSEK